MSGPSPRAAGSEVSVDGLKQLVTTLKVQLDTKYSNALRALTNVKEEFERNIQSPADPSPGRQQQRHLQECCEYRRDVPPPLRTSPGYRYEGRYRDEVNVSMECVGLAADTSQTRFALRAEDTYRAMKVSVFSSYP